MRALAHPTRLRMLELLRHEPLSASELARRLEIRFGSARFHLQQLVRGGLAHPAGDRRVRGGLELLFSAPDEVRVDIDPAEPATTAAMHHALVAELGRRLRSAATDQRRGDSDVDVVSLREVRLTPDGREEAQRIAADALRQIRALDTAPAEGDAEPVSLGLFLFRTPARRHVERRGPGMSEVRRRNVLFRNRMFRRLWTARAISFIGDGIAITALVLHVGSTNGTGTAVGALLLAQALPHLAGPMAGVIADRTDQRRLMIACNVGNTVVFAVAAWLLPGLLGLMLLVATSSILDTIFGPAGRSAIPALVDEDDLLSANAWLGTALNMQVAIGPLLGGLLVATLGIRGALAADAASFLLSAALLLRVSPLPPDRSRAERTSFLADTRAGLAYVRRQAVARAVVITLFLGVAFAGIDNVALVFLSREVLGAGALGFGVVAAAFGVGMLVASIALSGGRSRSPRTLFIGGWILTAAGTLLTGLAPVLWFAVAAQAIGGLGNGADNVASDTLIQRSVPGRCSGACSA